MYRMRNQITQRRVLLIQLLLLTNTLRLEHPIFLAFLLKKFKKLPASFWKDLACKVKIPDLACWRFGEFQVRARKIWKMQDLAGKIWKFHIFLVRFWKFTARFGKFKTEIDAIDNVAFPLQGVDWVWERRGDVFIYPGSFINDRVFPSFEKLERKFSPRLFCLVYCCLRRIWVKLTEWFFSLYGITQEFHIRVPSPYDLNFLLKKEITRFFFYGKTFIQNEWVERVLDFLSIMYFTPSFNMQGF